MAKKCYPHYGLRKYGQEVLSSLRMTKIWPMDTIRFRVMNIWPSDTILIKGDENMARKYYPY